MSVADITSIPPARCPEASSNQDHPYHILRGPGASLSIVTDYIDIVLDHLRT